MNEAKYGQILNKNMVSRFICIYLVAGKKSCDGCSDEPEECC